MKRSACIASLALFLIVLSASGAAAEVGVWEQVLPGQVMSVAVMENPVPGEPGIILAGTPDSGGILRSIDGGQSWASVLAPAAWSIAAEPNQAGVVYAATLGGLFRSLDYGVTWLQISTFIRSWVAVSRDNPQVVYGDHYKSTDGGQTWVPMTGLYPFVPAQHETSHITTTPASPALLYGIDGNNTMWSTNGGDSWFRYGEGGKHDTVAVDPVDGSWVYVGYCNGRFARYYNNILQGSLDISSHIHGIAVDPSSPNIVYAAGEDTPAVRRSDDHGVTWVPYSAGLDGTALGMIPEGRMVFNGSDGTVYLPTSTGLWRVATWGMCADGDGDLFFSGAGCGTAVDCDDADPYVYPGAPEECTDGIDNDCDSLVDTADPGAINCPCTDADGDLYFLEGNCGTAIDCDDADPIVNPGAAEECTDGIDNDCDSLVDAADPDAVNCPCTDADGDLYFLEGNCGTAADCNDADPLVNPGAAEECLDGLDNDCDLLADSSDPDCPSGTACADYTSKTACVGDLNCEWIGKPRSGYCQDAAGCAVTENPEVSCTDGADNDCDGLTDGDDPDCGGGSTEPEICDDGIDNDGDSKIDCADKGDCNKDPACR